MYFFGMFTLADVPNGFTVLSMGSYTFRFLGSVQKGIKRYTDKK